MIEVIAKLVDFILTEIGEAQARRLFEERAAIRTARAAADAAALRKFGCPTCGGSTVPDPPDTLPAPPPER